MGDSGRARAEMGVKKRPYGWADSLADNEDKYTQEVVVRQQQSQCTAVMRTPVLVMVVSSDLLHRHLPSSHLLMLPSPSVSYASDNNSSNTIQCRREFM